MGNIPTIRRLVRGDVITAAWLNAIAALAFTAARIRVGEGLFVRRDASGTFIGLEPRLIEQFPATITGAASDGDNKWAYTFARMQAVDDAYGTGFVQRAASANGLRTGTARRYNEWDSSASVAGGVDLTGTDYAASNMAPIRVPDGALVRVDVYRYIDSETGAGKVAYWFERAFAHDGGCA